MLAPVQRARSVTSAPVVLGLLAIAAVIYFDLGPNLPFNDDWLFAWSAQHVDWTGIQRFPIQGPSAYVQAVWGQVATFGNPSQYPLLRLSLVPFVLLAAASSVRMARDLGANRWWSAFAGAALLTTPVYLTLATSFMSDVPYIALVLAAAASGLNWVQQGRGRIPCLAWSTLAILQRQVGIGIPIALAASLLLNRKERKLERSDWVGLAILGVIAVAAEVLPAWLGAATDTETSYFQYLLQPQWDTIARSVTTLAPTLGFFLAPFAAAILFSRPSSRLDWISIFAPIVCLAGLVGIWIHLGDGSGVLPGDIWSSAGFTLTLGGAPKPHIFPDAIAAAVVVVASVTFVILLVIRWKLWSRGALGVGGTFLVVLAAVQTAEVLPTFVFDRYYLVSAALLIPVLAALASRTTRPRLALGWALAVAVAGLVLYAVGQQDYEAWQAARDEASRIAYQHVPPDQVYAGYEPQALYVAIPEYDQLGPNADVNGMRNFLIHGPASPRIVLNFAAADDPRPGVSYGSLASGRIVILGDLSTP